MTELIQDKKKKRVHYKNMLKNLVFYAKLKGFRGNYLYKGSIHLM